METAKVKNGRSKKIGYFCLTHVTEIVLVVVIIALWLANPNFMRISNWMNLLRSGAIKGIIALGVTMVLIAGKIDLSLGSQVALSGVIVAVFGKNMTAAGWSDLTVPCLIGMGVSLVVGVCCGGFHAFIQNKYNIPPFIITLAMQYVLFGLGATICNNYPIPNMYPDWFVQMGMGRVLRSGSFPGIPVPVIIFLGLWCIFYIIMEHTTTGRAIYSIGGNQEAARLSGISVLKTKMVVFISVQICAVVAGWVNSAMVMNADWTYAKDWPTDCITMAIIGGTAMTGGSGRIWGTLVGVVLISVLTNGMTILNWNIYVQYIVRGGVLLASLLIMTYRNKMRD